MTISLKASAEGAISVYSGEILNMVQLTSVNGTDTFDSGSVNILYEG